jgi:hypothetical protein
LPGLAVAALLLVSQPAGALINPKYTVVDLMRDCRLVLVVRVSVPADGVMTAEVVETLAGEPPAEKKLTLDFSKAEDLAEERVNGAFGGEKTALAVVCVQKKKQDGVSVGALEIGTTWMGLAEAGKGAWKLDKDPSDLETVWGGSVRQLIPAIRYVLKDSSPAFPVASAMNWGRDVSLGKLAGKAHGCLVTDDGAIVLSEGGDRVFQAGAKGAPPTDVTGKLALASKSKAMAAGDFNGDGRVDLASWDGAKVWLLLRGADGKFAAPAPGCELAECLSLAALGGGLVAGTGGGAVVLAPDGKGALAARGLDGPGGVCVVADFNGDGAPDLVQVSAEALTFHAGQAKALTFAAPVVTKVKTVKTPTAVVCGDFDTDGQLDVAVAGKGGAALLSRDERGKWANIMAETGELGAASGIAQGEASIVAACSSDLNGDGRQCVALFDAAAGPGLFFNRGFACFGVARSLTFTESKLQAAEALGGGQTAGMVCDLNGDLAPDLLAVDRQQQVWAIFGETESPRKLQITASRGGADPLTVTVSMGQRLIGIWVIRPGEPAAIGLPRAGKVTLRWKTADGTEASKDVIVASPAQVKLW